MRRGLGDMYDIAGAELAAQPAGDGRPAPLFPRHFPLVDELAADHERRLSPLHDVQVLFRLVELGIAGCATQDRSEEHTSELQSPDHLVCRLLLEKKKNTTL